MIKKIYESFEGIESDPNLLFWTYIICFIGDHGKGNRYDLIKVDNLTDRMERLGKELPLEDCREIIKKHEPSYSKSKRKIYKVVK